ncbi:MAG: PDZ domain-containing protein, partial [Calditrichaeota bacterium]
VYVQDLDRDLREYLGVDAPYGVLVNEVLPDSPAERAGLREEDVIIRFAGRRVRNTRDLTRAVERAEPGDKVKLEVLRHRRKKKLTLRVGESRTSSLARRDRDRRDQKTPRHFPFGDRRGTWLGVEITALNADLADYFDVSPGEGVLVLSVVEESPAAEAGLKAGDVILKVEGHRVEDEKDLAERIRAHEPGDEIKLRVKRRGKEKTLTAELRRAPRRRGSYLDLGDLQGWQQELDEWQRELHERLERRGRGRVDVEVHLRDLARELERASRDLDNQVTRELKQLADELENLRIEIRVRRAEDI